MNIVRELRNRITPLRKPEHLLIIRNDHLGDLILTLPLIEQATNWLDPDRVTVLVREPNDPILELLPWRVRRVFDPGGSYRKLGRIMANTGADTLICAASKTRNAWAAQCSGMPQRLGFGYNPNVLWFTHPLFVHRSSPPRHESQFCLDYLRKFDGVEVKPPVLPSFKNELLPEPPLDRILESGRKTRPGFIVVHPGHSGSASHPTTSQYRKLIELLTDESAHVLITCKGPEERKSARRLAGEIPGASPLETDLDLLEFSAVLRAASAFFGGSSGPLHLAALLEVPRVGFYSGDPRYCPAKWKPLGHNQMIITPPSDTDLHELKIDSLRDRIRDFLTVHVENS